MRHAGELCAFGGGPPIPGVQPERYGRLSSSRFPWFAPMQGPAVRPRPGSTETSRRLVRVVHRSRRMAESPPSRSPATPDDVSPGLPLVAEELHASYVQLAAILEPAAAASRE